MKEAAVIQAARRLSHGDTPASKGEDDVKDNAYHSNDDHAGSTCHQCQRSGLPR